MGYDSANRVEFDPRGKPYPLKNPPDYRQRAYIVKSENYVNKADQAKDASKQAILAGGKRLTGTAAQKAWGEKIRGNIIGKIADDSIIKKLVSVKDFMSSKFWIENRDEPLSVFVDKASKVNLPPVKAKVVVKASTIEKAVKKATGSKKVQEAKGRTTSLEKILSAVEKETRHKHIKQPDLTVDGVTVHIFDIPTLSKKMYCYEKDGKTYQAYAFA